MPRVLSTTKQQFSRFARRHLGDSRKWFEALIDQERRRREIQAASPEGAINGQRPRPDFLIIGAPKCGTSWLGAALTRQSRILMVPDEVEYFSSHLDRPLHWYLAHFEQLLASDKAKRAKPGDKLLLGEKSAGYCGLTPSRIRLVHRLLPDARLILMVRDPVKRHWSHAKRYFSKAKKQRRGYESLSSRQQLHRFFSRTRRFSEFSTMIENWTDVYPAGRLLIVSQEAAIADPLQTFDRVMRHIGVAGPNPPRIKHALRKLCQGQDRAAKRKPNVPQR